MRPNEKTMLDCPCGEHIAGSGEDDLIKRVLEHLSSRHPELDYTRDEILTLAY